MDTLAERLRRRPAKPMGSPRVGSNPTGVVCFGAQHHLVCGLALELARARENAPREARTPDLEVNSLTL